MPLHHRLVTTGEHEVLHSLVLEVVSDRICEQLLAGVDPVLYPVQHSQQKFVTASCISVRSRAPETVISFSTFMPVCADRYQCSGPAAIQKRVFFFVVVFFLSRYDQIRDCMKNCNRFFVTISPKSASIN